MKTYWGSGGIAPRIKLGTKWRRSGQLHAPAVLPQGKSSDNSVGIALGYGLDDRKSMVRFPAGAANFSLHHRVHNGSGAHSASYPICTRSSFPEGKAAEA
jgi:hypothetical protein